MERDAEAFSPAALLRELDARRAADRLALAEQVAQAELAQRCLSDHLGGAIGGSIRVRLAPSPDIEGTLIRVGRDHLWIADPQGFWLVATHEVDAILDWTRGPAVSARDSPESARGLGSAMRELIGLGGEASVLVGQRWFTSRLGGIGTDFAQFDDFTLPLGRVRACRVWY